MATQKPSIGARVANAIVSVLPKKKTPPIGLSTPNTFNPNALASDLAAPNYRDHLSDVFTDRSASDSRVLIQQLFRTDPDVSAAVNAYLTVADVEPWYIVRDSAGNISPQGHQALQQVLLQLTTRFDYTQPGPFYLQKSLRGLFEEMRYMVLLRGSIMNELILNKLAQPTELRHVDMATIRWQEYAPNAFLPIQVPKHASGRIKLDSSTIFVSSYRQDPTDVYSYSPFISAINTIASRQQVINDLYRIMKLTGYPRLDVSIVEEIVRKNAPTDCQMDAAKMATFLRARLSEIQTLVANMTPDQALVHYDSVTSSITNERSSAMSLNIDSIIDVLNAQNQAALKIMATVIGRGESGVNTGTVEARIFALNAEQLNRPVADILSQALTLAIRLAGVDAIVEVGFERIEMKSELELEPQNLIKQQRYLTLLSYGVISDDEFHIEMFNRPKPDFAPILSGTNFAVAPVDGTAAGSAAPSGQQPNAIDKSGTAPGGKAAKSKAGAGAQK